MLSWGPSTSWIEKSAATPQIWVEAASSSPTHASPGTRVSGTAWVRRHKRFGATPQNLGAGRIHSARAGQIPRGAPRKIQRFCGAGKKKMRTLGTVQLPTEAFMAVLKLDE